MPLSAAPVPFAFGPDVDVEVGRAAVGAEAAAPRQAQEILCEPAARYSRNDDVGSHAAEMIGFLCAANPVIVGPGSATGNDDYLAAIVTFNLVEQNNQARY